MNSGFRFTVSKQHKIQFNYNKSGEVMHLVTALFVISTVRCELTENDPSVYNFHDVLSTLLTGDNQRITELKNKIKHINSFTVDREKVADLMKNVTQTSNLTEINFYKSLSEGDNLFLEDDKNLYLKLKEKMNRDDILEILSKGDGQVMRSARKMLAGDLIVMSDEKELNDVVDKMIAETPDDVHQFDSRDNQSKYWDPQGELEDLHALHQHDGRRIFRGERTTVRYYPFMASIHVMGRFWCGGVIYWHDLVLTSAACLQLMHNNRFFRENPKILSVRVGSNHSRIGGEVIEALEVYFHPAYNPKTLRHNIAIIRLRRHLAFNYHRVPKIIDISHNFMGVPNTAEVLVLGWGVSKHDAGGPAVLSGKLVGIISFGPTVCGFPNAPTVFTLVGAYADWIETVNETMPGYYREKKKTTTSTVSPVMEMLDRWNNQQTNNMFDSVSKKSTALPPIYRHRHHK